MERGEERNIKKATGGKNSLTLQKSEKSINVTKENDIWKKTK